MSVIFCCLVYPLHLPVDRVLLSVARLLLLVWHAILPSVVVQA